MEKKEYILKFKTEQGQYHRLIIYKKKKKVLKKESEIKTKLKSFTVPSLELLSPFVKGILKILLDFPSFVRAKWGKK